MTFGAAFGASTPTQAGRWRAGVGRAAPVVAVAAIAAATVVRDPHIPGSWAVCPTYALFGVYCPGCGSLRALHDLAVGHWGEGLGHNLLVAPAVGFLVYGAVRSPAPVWSRVWLWGIVLFTVLRNVPGSPLAP